MFNELNNENLDLFAAKYYRNPACISKKEFYDDLARFKYVLRLLRRYRTSGIIQERLVLNHLITIYNVFEIHAANRILFYRIDKDLWPAIKAFLLYLNYLPEGHTVYNSISIDLYVAKKLQIL